MPLIPANSLLTAGEWKLGLGHISQPSMTTILAVWDVTAHTPQSLTQLYMNVHVKAFICQILVSSLNNVVYFSIIRNLFKKNITGTF